MADPNDYLPVRSGMPLGMPQPTLGAQPAYPDVPPPTLGGPMLGAPPIASNGYTPVRPKQTFPMPNQADYQAPPISLTRRILGSLAVGAGAFKSPELGQQIQQEVFQAPQEQADKRYENAVQEQQRQTTQEDAAQKQDLAEKEAASKEPLTQAQTSEANARTDAITNPPPKAAQVLEVPAGGTLMDEKGNIIGTGTVKPETEKPGEYKPYTVPGSKTPILASQKGDKLLTRDGKELPPNAVPFEKPEAGQKPPQQLVMVPNSDGTTSVVEAKPGVTLPKGATTLGEAGKQQTAADSAKAAQAYADDYMANKQFTGAGDEALMEKYFELAKPSSGFRMTQPQIEMLTKARDIMGGLQARGKHLFSPEAPYFSTTQREQIVQTMKSIQQAKDETRGGGKTAATAKNWNAKTGRYE
jgi:hypothetical protein